MFFDFHHHHFQRKEGIYNLHFLEKKLENAPFSVGFHPKDVENITEKDWEWLYQNSQSPFCWTIGECGLDANVSASEELQEQVFARQIEWANQVRKPVVIHCVRRFSSLLKFKKIAKVPMIIHGFNKNKNIANEVLAKGFFLSFGKALLHKDFLQEIVAKMPIQQLFLETDDTDFDITLLYQKVAELKNIPLSEVQNAIQINLENIRIQ